MTASHAFGAPAANARLPLRTRLVSVSPGIRVLIPHGCGEPIDAVGEFRDRRVEGGIRGFAFGVEDRRLGSVPADSAFFDAKRWVSSSRACARDRVVLMCQWATGGAWVGVSTWASAAMRFGMAQ